MKSNLAKYVLYLTLILLAGQVTAQSMLHVNKIKAGEALIVHAEFTVLSEKVAIGGLNFEFFNAEDVALYCEDNFKLLQKENEDNYFLSDAGNGFQSYIGNRSFHRLWLIETPHELMDSSCADQIFFKVTGSYSETSYELETPAHNFPLFQNADETNRTVRDYLYSLRPSVNPPVKTMTKTRTFADNAFIALTYFYDLFEFTKNPASIEGPAMFRCIADESGDVSEFTWPLSEVTRADEKFMGRTVSIIPIIVPPGEEQFSGLSHCEVSYSIVTSAFGGNSQTINFELFF
ncbi:hypothetical protein [Pseudidiomarina taiwanensis]|uniref:Uncharacterized protein n=1 Tax=Pseudidiomarina taiwanensis TaxID=337250 RepID=A0A432ZL24_9GAMM|nr:hypothetical protein [Pseudidiomarina taiwanensis]RUO78697.1 hypothetical protein CWI83_06670 [Pseudidiomarina taiwanensis]